MCKNPCYRAPLTGTPPHYLLSKSQSSSSYKLHHSLQRTIFVHFVFVSTSHFVFVSTFHFVFVFTFHFVFVSTSSILYLIPHFLFCICDHVSYLHLRAYFQLVFIFTHLFGIQPLKMFRLTIVLALGFLIKVSIPHEGSIKQNASSIMTMV